ncbi:uncharacterized protein BdWA1_003963 [Babesia duncani]|uniref:Uncharacterized protein n=1 Tax=Babesia duncani TaxID=323732 RepID=A0AAD9PH42_9APIC|nr:hypothetical protein BdWA1_003963 [Babesia duncani]
MLLMVFVYACKDVSNKFHPWLLQFVGQRNASYNYFFKFDKDYNVFKNHQFTNLTVSSPGGSFELKEDEQAKSRTQFSTATINVKIVCILERNTTAITCLHIVPDLLHSRS